MNRFNASFWRDKYAQNSTGWDLGQISTPLKTYFDQLTGKNSSILIPGGGNSYEAQYLFENGFKNVFLLDIVNQPLINFKKRVQNFPTSNLIEGDFFNHKSQYDLIIEQTFFCALDPTLRAAYVKQMHRLLKPGGKLVGLLFNFPLTEQGPPFGGSIEEYLDLFPKYFKVTTLEKSDNSLNERDGKELFIIFEKLNEPKHT